MTDEKDDIIPAQGTPDWRINQRGVCLGALRKLFTTHM